MSKKTRKEHIVPQAHIRNFGYKNNNTNKIIVIDKKKNQPYKTSVDDVACQRDFYEVSDKETNYWEKWYGKIEQNIPGIYSSIIINSRFALNGQKVLSEYLKKELSLIIISQLLRTEVSKKHFIKMGYEISNSFIDTVESMLKSQLSDKHIEILNKYRNNEDFVYSSALTHWNSTLFLRKSINILRNKIWIIHKNMNYKTNPFVTSDNPVIMYNFFTKKAGFDYNGLIKDGTIIYYPINKELLIAIYPKLTRLKKHNNTIDFLNDDKFVMNFNRTNYEQCERQVFYSL